MKRGILYAFEQRGKRELWVDLSLRLSLILEIDIVIIDIGPVHYIS